MKKRLKKQLQKQWAAGVLVAIILLGIASCSANADPKDGEIVERDSAYFEVKAVVPQYQPDGAYYYECIDVAKKGDETAILLNYINEQNYTTGESVVLFLDEEGEQIYTFPFQNENGEFSFSSATYMKDGRLAVLGFDSSLGEHICILSASRDEAEEIITLPPSKARYQSFMEKENQWVLLSYRSMTVTDKTGHFISENPLPFEPYPYELFELEGLPSFWAASGMNLTSIVSFNLETGSFTEKTHDKFEELGMGGAFFREYIINNKGVFRFDFSSGKQIEIADWNVIDLIPSDYFEVQTRKFVLDDDTIIRVTHPVQPGNNDEIYLMKHRETDPNSDKEVLTIGGYGVSRNKVIARAIYIYNTGNHPYRIQAVDYYDKYGIHDDPAGISRANAEIIRDMRSGNGDDIFFGAEFNYDLWGRAGIVVDMMECINKDAGFELDRLIPEIVSLAQDNGHLYQLFPNFVFQGFVGYSDILTSTEPLTVERACETADRLSENQRLFCNSLKIDMAISAIEYRLNDFYSKENGVFISDEEFQKIIDYAERFGSTEENFEQTMISDPNSAYVTERLILKDSRIISPYQYNQLEQMGTSSMMFFGTPSVYDSTRLCVPGNLLAISAGSKDVDACWDFIKILFSKEIQIRFMQGGGSIPVSIDMYEAQIEKAMEPNLMTSEEQYNVAGYIAPRPMSAESAEHYRKCVASLNALYSLNIDLRIILWEELASYFDGGKALSDVRKTINNRVNLYLNE